MFAHIYKARGGKFELILTTGAAINTGVVSVTIKDTKQLAKDAAKSAGAKPHNYR